MSFLVIVLCVLCCNFVRSDTYKAAVVDVSDVYITSGKYESLIHEAAENDVDLLVIPSPKTVQAENLFDSSFASENYDEIIKSVSSAAKKANIYVVVHLYERSRCQNREELVKNNLVFNRDGAIISVYGKPVRSLSKCNATVSKISRFTTDFGVTFGVLSEDDVFLTNVEEFKGIDNFIVSSSSETSILFAKQFTSSWAYTNSLNVINENGKLSGIVDLKKASNHLTVAEFEKHGANDIIKTLTTTPLNTYTTGDTSQYVIKPLNMEASAQGYEDTVCHNSFCCQFYVKTSSPDSKTQVSYGLVVFDGVQSLGNNNIGVQTCAVAACAGMNKRSCFTGPENSNTNVKFERISINMKNTNDNACYPTILTSTQNIFNGQNFKFTAQNKHITTELHSAENVLTFGIFGRDYTKDYETFEFGSVNGTDNIDFSEYISSENVQEFFDYVWIRLRVLIFVVSIYVLEML